MKKKSLKKYQELLEKEKKEIEEKLQRLLDDAKEITIKIPDFSTEGEEGSVEADQVEEMSNLISLKQVWEGELKNIDEALERIKKGIYGICQKCQKEIDEKRLEVEPTAIFCSECLKKMEGL